MSNTALAEYQRERSGSVLVSSRAPTSEAYAIYLRTPHWRALRRKVLLRWRGLCENCATAPAAEVHHKTYERMGNELLTDLTPLCSECHKQEHV